MKTVLITGATSGIGKATAELLAKTHCRIIICGRNEEVLKQMKTELSCITEIFSLKFDIRENSQVENAYNSLPDNWKKIDVLINNAGNAHGMDSLENGNIEDWDAMMDGNVKGILYISKLIIPGMKKQKSGHIVNISSTAARQTYANGVVYCASKKAVDIISEGMRLELTEFGIKVTNLQPGLTETDFSKVRFKGDEERAKSAYKGFKPLKAEDVAGIIKFMLEVPEHVNIADLTVLPSAQAAPGIVRKK